MKSRIREEVWRYMGKHPEASGVELSRRFPTHHKTTIRVYRREWLSAQAVESERGSMTERVLLYLNKHGDRTMKQLNYHFSGNLTPNQVKSAITVLRTRGDVDVVGKTDDGIYIFGVPSTRDDPRRPLIEKHWPSTGVMGNTL